MATYRSSLYTVQDSMSGISCLRRTHTTYVDRARGKVYRLYVADTAPCADTRSIVLPYLQADVYVALELDPEETSATLPAPRGAANVVGMERAAVARQARQWSAHDQRSLY